MAGPEKIKPGDLRTNRADPQVNAFVDRVVPLHERAQSLGALEQQAFSEAETASEAAFEARERLNEARAPGASPEPHGQAPAPDAQVASADAAARDAAARYQAAHEAHVAAQRALLGELTNAPSAVDPVFTDSMGELRDQAREAVRESQERHGDALPVSPPDPDEDLVDDQDTEEEDLDLGDPLEGLDPERDAEVAFPDPDEGPDHGAVGGHTLDGDGYLRDADGNVVTVVPPGSDDIVIDQDGNVVDLGAPPASSGSAEIPFGDGDHHGPDRDQNEHDAPDEDREHQPVPPVDDSPGVPLPPEGHSHHIEVDGLDEVHENDEIDEIDLDPDTVDYDEEMVFED